MKIVEALYTKLSELAGKVYQLKVHFVIYSRISPIFKKKKDIEIFLIIVVVPVEALKQEN